MSLPTNFFIGRGGGAAPVLFDAYGVSAGDISSLSSVTYNTQLVSGTLYNSHRSMASLMLANSGSTTNDPTNSRLITSQPHQEGGLYSLHPIEVYPTAASGGWGGVTTSSDISFSANTFLPAVNDGSWTQYGGQFGGSHYTDTTSSQVICRAFQYSQQTGSDYDVATRYVAKNPSTGNYDLDAYLTPISDGTPSTRFNIDLHSAENSMVQVGKDQTGGSSGYSGQPLYMHLRQLTNSGSKGNYFETLYTAQANAQNTHAHSNRGVYLGAQVQGIYMVSWYFIQYNDWSSGADGYRFVRLRQPTSNNSPMAVDLTAHNSKDVNQDGGVLFQASNVYPHAFFTDASDTTIGYASQGAMNATTYYVDLSETWSSSTGFTLYNLGTNNKKYYARVGGTTSAPVFAFLSGGNVKIQPFDPSTRTWGSTIASVAIQNSNECNGIWPIPETNRIVVSYQNGIELLEAA